MPATAARRRDAVEDARRALSHHDYEAAAAAARRAIAHDAGDARGWFLLGMAEFGAGRAEAARAAFAAAAERAPASATIRMNLAAAAFAAHRYDEAERAFVAAAGLDPELAARAQLDAGFAAVKRGHLDDAQRHLREGLLRAPASDRALQSRADELVDAIDAAREDAARASVRRLVHEARAALAAGHAAEANERITSALEAARESRDPALENDLADIARVAQGTAETTVAAASSRLSIEASVGGGWDTNVVQSGTLITNVAGLQKPGGALLAADFEIVDRAVGSPRNALFLKYSFSQTAYLDPALDPWSLQEHTLTVTGRATPLAWLTAEAFVDGGMVMSGVVGYGLFAAVADPGVRATVREGRGFELRASWEHGWRLTQDPAYAYLDGDSDEVLVAEAWRSDTARVSLGYRFHGEYVGREDIPVADLFGPDGEATFGTGAVDHISYSYLAHGGWLTASWAPTDWLRLEATGRYEHRFYYPASWIDRRGDPTPRNVLLRDDDRFVVDTSVAVSLPAGFGLEAAWTFIANLSNIDDTRNAFDYDDKNFSKHVVQLAATWVY